MRVKVYIESLRCTAGSSNKGYQVIKWLVNDTVIACTKVYGPLDNPNQMMSHPDGAGAVHDEYFKTVKNKLKKYNRAHGEVTAEWSGTRAEWLDGEGLPFLVRAMYSDCNLWQRSTYGEALSLKMQQLVKDIPRWAGDEKVDQNDEVEDLFRTPKQRSKAREEREELQSLDNWGCF